MRSRSRRRLLALAASIAGAAAHAGGTGADGARGRAPASPAEIPPVREGIPLVFPRDHGAHRRFRVEWWYVTGWLDPAVRPRGFQLTFFRVRTGYPEANPSPLAPRQLLLAHAALADPATGHLRHMQRAWRTGPGARCADSDTLLEVPQAFLERSGDDRYRARADAPDFGFELSLVPTGPPVLQGEAGFSRKGPAPNQASYYYSRPQLRVSGRLRDRQREIAIDGGLAWLDHEWSDELLPAGAVGWDWLGINLSDGSTLVAFRLRDAHGATLYAHGRLRSPDGRSGDAVPHFDPGRTWRSPRTGDTYPVEWGLALGSRRWRLEPLMDDQELDARASTGTVYWEGAVRLVGPAGVEGLGYLELTGYGSPMRL